MHTAELLQLLDLAGGIEKVELHTTLAHLSMYMGIGMMLAGSYRSSGKLLVVSLAIQVFTYYGADFASRLSSWRARELTVDSWLRGHRAECPQ